MNQILKTAIIGGGASGLLCAVELTRGANALNGEEIAIFESLDRVGKKLISTGNGQGNLTNSKISSENFYGDKDFINAFLERLNGVNLDEYFYSLGIPLTTVGDKKYPLSRQASSVLDSIRAYLASKNVKEVTNFKVEKIIREKGWYRLVSGERSVCCEKIVLAVGGSAGKQYGTDGSSYALAEGLGHKKTKLYPSLVQIKTETQPIRALKGLKEQAKVTAYDGDQILKISDGEVLFTDYGLSGNAIFQVSGHLAMAKNPTVKIEFLPSLTEEEVRNLIVDKYKNTPYIDKAEVLSGVLVKRVGQAVLKTAKSQSAKDVAYAIKNFTLKVTGTLDFNYAQVTKGGIKTDGVNPQTFESKLSRGVYLTGEILNVDGDCGGYNLTFAFASGIIAARAIKNEYNR